MMYVTPTDDSTDFLPVLLEQAGIVSPDRQRVLNFVNSATSFIGALVGTAIVDKVGRRKLMLFASVCCMCGMAIVAGLLSDAGEKNQMRANAGICFICGFLASQYRRSGYISVRFEAGRDPLTIHSPVYGLLFFRVDPIASSLSCRSPVF
jgi:MFS family permease